MKSGRFLPAVLRKAREFESWTAAYTRSPSILVEMLSSRVKLDTAGVDVQPSLLRENYL